MNDLERDSILIDGDKVAEALIRAAAKKSGRELIVLKLAALNILANDIANGVIQQSQSVTDQLSNVEKALQELIMVMIARYKKGEALNIEVGRREKSIFKRKLF